MELNKCMGCMEDFLGYPCPKCGFDPGQVRGNEYALPIQTILAGKYLVGRVLGQGGFGITYIGWDIALERKVAIKEYYPSGQVSRSPGTRNLTWYTSEQARHARQTGMEMFLKEARKMAKVDDIPGVVRIRDLFQENETAYIVMDFVEGETLKARLRRNGPMTWAQAGPIFHPAILAMEKVHRAGLIHRDLSPDNLMLTPDGQVKILDLGAAKDLNINSGASSMQVAKGGFSPFEQYTQRGGSGPWTDVYAMAATVYYALTGKVPPVATDRVDEDTIAWNLPYLNTLPPSALEALKSAMAVSAKKRMQTMEELEEGLYEMAEPEPRPVVTPVPEPKPIQMPTYETKAKTRVEQERIQESGSGKGRKSRKINWVLVATMTLMCGTILWLALLKPAIAYREAQALLDAGKYEEAAEAFAEINFLDSKEKAKEARDTPTRQQMETASKVVAAGGFHTVGLRSDGWVTAIGGNLWGQRDVIGWRDIVAVSAGLYHTVGLHSNGTVSVVGSGGTDETSWRNIVAVSAGNYYTVGLCNDGTVLATGENTDGRCDVSSWRNIVDISAGGYSTLGLCSDGTVLAVGNNTYGQCDVKDWENIVAVSAGLYHTIGLRKDGTVMAIGNNAYGQCNVDDWKNIVAVSAGSNHTVGLRNDGTVVAVGGNGFGQCNVSSWSDIVAVSAGWGHTVGLRSDGTVVATGYDNFGQCEVDSWTNIRTP